MGIETKEFLTRVEEIAAEEPSYRHGGWGSDGTCDCIGLIIGAIRRCGGNWRGTHGSNYAARSEVWDLKQIRGNSDLQPGDVVFKSWEPSQPKYDLPGKYKPGGECYDGDVRDYYHVGVVVSVYPVRIRHMTAPRPKMDTRIGSWSWAAKLKKVSAAGNSKGEKQMEQIIVYGGNENAPINMRQAGSKGSAVIAEIPQGAEAELIEGGGEWNQIRWNGKTGYVMSSFVHGQTAEEGNTIQVSREEVEKVYDIIGGWLGKRG